MTRLLLLLTLMTAGPATARQVHLGVRFGSAGPGVEVVTQLGPRVHARVAGYYWSWDAEGPAEYGPFRYDRQGSLGSGLIGVSVDAALSENWAASVGLWTLAARGRLDLVPEGAGELAGAILEADDLGRASFNARFPQRSAPYFGIRHMRRLPRGYRLSAEVGLVITGSPVFESETEGRLAGSSQWRTHLQEAFSDVWALPLVGLGLELPLRR